MAELAALKCGTPECSHDAALPVELPPTHKAAIELSTGRVKTVRWSCDCGWTRYEVAK
jgi:hypothetical protein